MSKQNQLIDEACKVFRRYRRRLDPSTALWGEPDDLEVERNVKTTKLRELDSNTLL